MSYSQGGGGSVSKLSDAALNNPADGQVLAYNATLQKWQNAAVAAPAPPVATATVSGTIKLAGDIAGTADTVSVAKIKGVTLPVAAPAAGQVLTASSATATAWSTPTSAPAASNATTTAPGLVQLAGDLAGTATAPTIASTTNVNAIISANATVTGNTTAIAAKAAKGANGDITSLTGLTTALSVTQGGTGSTTAAAALTALGALAASQKAAASGVASLDSATLVPRAQLGAGTASASTVLYGDGAWRTAPVSSTQYIWTATKTSAYTAASGDAVICDGSTTGFTVTLPTNLGANAFVRVKKIDSSVNAILVTSPAGIDGSATFSINSQNMSQDFSYTGSTWYAV